MKCTLPGSAPHCHIVKLEGNVICWGYYMILYRPVALLPHCGIVTPFHYSVQWISDHTAIHLVGIDYTSIATYQDLKGPHVTLLPNVSSNAFLSSEKPPSPPPPLSPFHLSNLLCMPCHFPHALGQHVIALPWFIIFKLAVGTNRRHLQPLKTWIHWKSCLCRT